MRVSVSIEPLLSEQLDLLNTMTPQLHAPVRFRVLLRGVLAQPVQPAGNGARYGRARRLG